MAARPLLLGHRGQRHTRRRIVRYFKPEVIPPDNTLAAFALTMARGCDGFEFDVRYTHDRRGVICHDPDFAGYNVANSKYESLREANARERRVPLSGDEQIPCLEDVLARFAESAYLDIEIKITGFEEDIVKAIHAQPPKLFVVSSFHPAILHTFHELDATLPLGYICSDRKLLPRWRELPVNVVIPHVKLTSELLVREWHAEGKEVFIWTVNREVEMRRLAMWGVDGIISDDTELMVKVLGKTPA